MALFKKMLFSLLLKHAGNKRYQTIYLGLYNVSLVGMNYGAGTNINNSGEIYALKYVREKLNQIKSPILFDVGANIGTYSILLNQLFGNSACIVAIEASKKTYDILLKNTHHLPQFFPVNIGIGKEEAEAILYSNENDSGLSSVYKRALDFKNIKMDAEEKIHITTIDAVCKNYEFNEIHFLKLDIEGNELDALKGIQPFIQQKRVHFIQFEFGGCNIDSRTYFKDFFYMLKENYTIYRIVKNGLVAITEYNERLEIFTTTNYLAEKKE